MKGHQKKEGNIIRQYYEPPNKKDIDEKQHHTRYVVVRKAVHAGFNTRESNAKFIWGCFKDEDDNDILALGFEPANEEERSVAPAREMNRKASHKASSLRSTAVAPLAEEKIVQMLTTGVYVIKTVASNVCEAMAVNRIKDTGNVPKKILNMYVGRSLRAMFDMKSYFERNGLVVDKEVRDVFVNNIPKAVVSSQVSDIVDKLNSVNFAEDMWKPLPKDSDAFVKLSKIHVEGENSAWGKAETIVDSSAEKVRAKS